MVAPFDQAPSEELPAIAKILVVDDEESMRATAQAMLAAAGFEVILAEDGAEALQKYLENRFEIALVLMDVTMPRLGGVEATQIIRELDPSAKVILSSGYWDNAPVIKAKPNAFLQKPYTLRNLHLTVHQVLNSHRLKQFQA